MCRRQDRYSLSVCIAEETVRRQSKGSHCADLLLVGQNHHVLLIGVQLNSHFIHIEHEGGVDALVVVGEVAEEQLDLPLLCVDPVAVSGRAKLVDKAGVTSVLPQRFSRDGDVELVCSELHQYVRRDRLVSLVSVVDEVLEAGKTSRISLGRPDKRRSSPRWRR